MRIFLFIFNVFLLQQVYAAEICTPEVSTFPLSAAQVALFTSASESVSPPPGDSAIVTASDAYICGKTISPTTHTYDPAQLPDDGSAWRVGSNRWSTEMERQFSDWITTEVGSDFFVKYNIPTDCADAVVSLRTIFSRIHHLPVAYDTYSGIISQTSKKYATQKTVTVWNDSNWKQALLHDQRFRSFLSDLREQMSTHNLNKSTYPIELTSCSSGKTASDFLTPGKVLLDEGHVRMITKMDTAAPYDPMKEMSSTVPAKVRNLNERSPTLFTVPEPGLGVLGWRWPINCGKGFVLTEEKKMAGYSAEQYSVILPSGVSFSGYLSSLVPGERKPYDQAYLDLKLEEVKKDFTLRIEVVDEAIKKLKENPKIFDNPESEVYENYSTPSRDNRIKNTFNDAFNRLHGSHLSGEYEKEMRKLKIDLGDGKWIDGMDFLYANMSGKVSSNPNASKSDRWGFSFIQDAADSNRKAILEQKNRLDYFEAQGLLEVQKLIPSDRLLHDQGQLKTPSEKQALDAKHFLHVYHTQLSEALARGAK